MAEALVLLKGIHLTEAKHFSDFAVTPNAANIINFVLGFDMFPWSIRHVITDIHHVLSMLFVSSNSHIPGSLNSVAHSLANIG